MERIFARSEGNPFYAEQLLAAGAGDAQLALPATLADVLLVRVQALTEPAQQVLRVAAVAGRRVSHRLLAQVVGRPEPELEEALREAIGAGVLMVDARTGTYAFRHALLQEAVYGDLLPSEQVRLHAAYASLLAAEADGAAAELAYHCLASHDLPGALAASVRAAQESAAVLAPAETLRHLSSALKLWERVPDPAAVTGTDRIDLTLRAAEAAAAAGEEHQAAALAQAAAAIADAAADPARAARAYERRGALSVPRRPGRGGAARPGQRGGAGARATADQVAGASHRCHGADADRCRTARGGPRLVRGGPGGCPRRRQRRRRGRRPDHPGSHRALCRSCQRPFAVCGGSNAGS